jgi:mRNA interferase RelE/StbE
LVWTIEITDTAQKQLAKLDKRESRRIIKFIKERLSNLDDPRKIGKVLKGPLGGLWRYRVGDNRIICDIQDGAVCVLVLKVGKRSEVYR